MRNAFDRRVVPDDVLALIRACQQRVPTHLAGGAALSGAYLAHRLSLDIDLVCHQSDDIRTLVREFPDVSRQCGIEIELVRDGGSFVRARARPGGHDLGIDLIFEATPDIEQAPPIDGVVVESLADLRAAKLTCLLSRSEPRDLVDLLFLDRAGFAPEHDLPLALRKDAGIDPAVLAWLLGQFPLSPLPVMLAPTTIEDLARFRDDLRERFRLLAVPAKNVR